jgi:hypothetical protein
MIENPNMAAVRLGVPLMFSFINWLKTITASAIKAVVRKKFDRSPEAHTVAANPMAIEVAQPVTKMPAATSPADAFGKARYKDKIMHTALIPSIKYEMNANRLQKFDASIIP